MLSTPRHFHSLFLLHFSCPGCRAEPLFGAVEHALFGGPKEDPVSVVIHLLKADLLVAEHFADKHPAVKPAHIAVVVRAACLKRVRVLEVRNATRQGPCTVHIDAARRLIRKRSNFFCCAVTV